MRKIGLLPRIIIAIALGLLLGKILPSSLIRGFLTFNAFFAEFLSFCIPLIVVGLISSSIADLGSKAKGLLVITVVIAYISTLYSGFLTYFVSIETFPKIIDMSQKLSESIDAETGMLKPYFSIGILPLMDIVTALVLSFVLGIGMSSGKAKNLHQFFVDFRHVMESLISAVIVPALPFYIFGIFLNMRYSGAAFDIIAVFGKIIIVIFILHVFILFSMFVFAGIISKKNPFFLIKTMMPAYMTALGTSSSAATIPVTLIQSKKAGVSEEIADFVVPLCATIHLTGSMMKIVATSLAICMIEGINYDLWHYTGFIFMLAVSMVAAPGVPGGAIMVAVGVLQSMLGFGKEAIGIMIAIYIAIDSFGTACNVTGDGAIAVMVDKINSMKKSEQS